MYSLYIMNNFHVGMRFFHSFYYKITLGIRFMCDCAGHTEEAAVDDLAGLGGP